MKSIKIGRRSFIKGAVAIAASGLLGGGAIKRTVNNGTIPYLLGHIHEPEEIAQAFQHAEQGSLMASYAVFFPTFITSHPISAPDLLAQATESVARKNSSNKHRLDALPAVAAVHCLTRPIYQREDSISLGRWIVKALNDPRREVREIVLQNLLASTCVNYDTIHISVLPDVIDAIKDLIIQSKESNKYVVPLCHSVQYLLIVRSILSQIESVDHEQQVRKISEILDSVFPQKGKPLPEHFWFAQKMVRLWENLPKPNLQEPMPFLPQASESLIGWYGQKWSSPYEEILKHFALLRVMNLFTAFITMEGIDASQLDIMDQQQASVIVKKMLAFDKTYYIDKLLVSSVNVAPDWPSLGTMSGFDTFLKKMYWKSLNEYKFSEEAMSALPGQRILASLVPFKRFDDRLINWEIWRHSSMSFWDYMEILAAFISGGAGVDLIWRKLAPLTHVLKGINLAVIPSKELEKTPSKKESERIEAEVLKAVAVTEETCSQNLDNTDKKYGKVNVSSDGKVQINIRKTNNP